MYQNKKEKNIYLLLPPGKPGAPPGTLTHNCNKIKRNNLIKQKRSKNLRCGGGLGTMNTHTHTHTHKNNKHTSMICKI